MKKRVYFSFVHTVQISYFSAKTRVILSDKFIGSDANVKGVGFGPTHTFKSTFLLSSEISQNLKCRSPFFDFHFPIQHDGCGYDN